MENRAYSIFKVGFDKCTEQFEEAGHIPADKKDLPDLEEAISSLLDENSVIKEPGLGDEEPKDPNNV